MHAHMVEAAGSFRGEMNAALEGTLAIWSAFKDGRSSN